jgi:hemoglobin
MYFRYIFNMNPDSAGKSSREAMAAAIAAETGIDEAVIETVVRTFYGRARHDPLIGPVFDAKVEDWETHIAKMCAFWSSVTLMSGRYHGQPMAAHAPLPIEPKHFDRWLEIFAATVREVCPQAAGFFLERAHRIADSLELGIAVQKGALPAKRSRPASTFPPMTRQPQR